MIQLEPISEEAVPELARIHRQAFRGYMNARLGDAYARALIQWFRAGGQRIAIAACTPHNRPVGYALGAPVPVLKHLSRDLFGTAATALLLRPWLLVRSDIRTVVGSRLRSVLGVPGPAVRPSETTPTTFSLLAIGVSDEMRGQGVGKLLLAGFEAEAKARGATELQLTVYSTNTAALRAYRGSGWVEAPGQTETKSGMYFRKPVP